MDDLTFTYRGNQVTTITDAVPNTLLNGVMEFKDDNVTGYSDYACNKNGYPTHDINKRITGIRYNYLNLPQELQLREGHKTVYSYDAGGVKHRVRHITAMYGVTALVVTSGNLDLPEDAIEMETITDYIGNKIYENDSLKFILTAEGFVSPQLSIKFDVPNGKTCRYVHYYALKDHLGSSPIYLLMHTVLITPLTTLIQQEWIFIE